jgi:hypothetical protein
MILKVQEISRNKLSPLHIYGKKSYVKMPDYILQNVLSDQRCEKCGAEVELAFQDSRDCGIAREVWKDIVLN